MNNIMNGKIKEKEKIKEKIKEKEKLININYKVIRSDIKNFYIRVNENEVIIKAPKRATDKEIQKVFESKKQWIIKKLKEYESSTKKKKEYVEGEIFKIYGKEHKLKILYVEELKKNQYAYEIKRPDLIIKLSKACEDLSKEDKKEKVEQAINGMYKALAQEEMPLILDKMSEIMNVKANNYRIKKLKSIWGSCSTTKNITINQDLMMYSGRARVYVAIHELCHLKYMNHSKDFWNMVKTYMPDYKEAEKELKS